MQLNALQAFLAVADTGSFSKAATHLYLSQPAVSKRVGALESELGTPLFDRAGHTVTLTEAGRVLLPRARALLLELTDIKKRICNLSGEIGGTLPMGTSHHIGLHRLPEVLRRFTANHSQVQLDIRFMDSETLCDEVARGTLELAVVTLPTDTPPTLNAEALWDDPLEVVVGTGHALAKSTDVDIGTLLGHRAVLPAPETFTGTILRAALGSHAEALDTGMSTNYLETLRMLASVGLGWTLLPRTMLVGGDLLPLRVPGLVLTRTLGIVTHKARTLSNAARAMIDTCRGFA